MQSLASMYKAVKTAVSGNREVQRFEHSFGLPVEEKAHITPVNAGLRRILGQLAFALELNKTSSDQYKEPIRDALEFLQARIDETGTLSTADALEAEEPLLALSAAAKEYSLILCSHAHIDMNWMWSWQETVAVTLDTFRTMLAIMREYPEFTFSQSQSSVYKIVEDYEPAMMDEIKQRIREGRWEVTSSAWVETDKNMPSGESLTRHILYSKKYLSAVWGVEPSSLQIDFSPDTFGHSANIPEIDLAGGVQYMYHCRGNDTADVLYRWRAPSGKEILVYREPYWYNSGIRPHIGIGLPEIARRCGGLKTGLIVYGVGDHGGGPTRRDIERALEMQGWPVFPRVRFGTFAQYFKEAEAVRDHLPLAETELNYIFAGCYTTQSRIKMGNRHSEKALYQAEALSALANITAEAPYATGVFEEAWRNVLFTHFHDILTGSCVQDSREHAMGLYSHALTIANTQRSQAMRAIAGRIDTSALASEERIADSQSEGAGVGYGIDVFSPPAAERGSGKRRVFHVFNPSASPRRAVAELTVWDWPGDLRQACFTNHQGEKIAHQLLHGEPEKYWDHLFFKALVDVDLPALGYATVILDEADIDEYPFYYHRSSLIERPHQNFILENDYLRVEICFKTGAILSVIEKAIGTETLGGPAGLRLVECDGELDSAWVIGRYMTSTPLNNRVKVAPMPCGGELRNGVLIETPVMNSTVKSTILLERHSRALKIELTVDWHEISKGKGMVPTLVFAAPTAYHAREYLYDIPAGALRRPPLHIDVPAQSYGAAVYEDGVSLALAADSKYGFRGNENTVSVTLIHSANRPDPYPERGIHHIRLALFAGRDCPKWMKEAAFDALNEPAAISSSISAGDLPMTSALLELGGDTTAVLSAVKQAEDGTGLIVRMYETAGKKTRARLIFQQPVKAAQRVDSHEQALDGEIPVCGNEVDIGIGSNALAAVKITF